MEVSCAPASNEEGAVCLQGGVKGEGLPEEILAQVALSGAAVFHHRTHHPVAVGTGLWVQAWLGKNHR